jgi:hypothetical protein
MSIPIVVAFGLGFAVGALLVFVLAMVAMDLQK